MSQSGSGWPPPHGDAPGQPYQPGQPAQPGQPQQPGQPAQQPGQPAQPAAPQQPGSSEHWQQPAQPGYPSPGYPQQGGQSPYEAAGAGVGAPGGPPGAGGGPGGGGPSGGDLGGPGSGGPPDGTPPGGGPTQPKKRPWGLIITAIGCVLLLLVVLVGGAGFLLLRDNQNDPEATADPEATTDTPTESTTVEDSEPREFEVLSGFEELDMEPEEYVDVFSDNPLSDGDLPWVDSCDLPELAKDHTNEELEAFLGDGVACLGKLWGTASSDRALPWSSPNVVVYTWPEVPDSACDADSFSERTARVCNLDNTIYWPTSAETFVEPSDDAEAPGVYLWELSSILMQTVTWQSSIAIYYGNFQNEYEDEDSEMTDDATRRFFLQHQCISSAAVMSLPSNVQPSPDLITRGLEPGTWVKTTEPKVSDENYAEWMRTGVQSRGDISVCNTWEADDEAVQ